jgi:hypothetical protein
MTIRGLFGMTSMYPYIYTTSFKLSVMRSSWEASQDSERSRIGPSESPNHHIDEDDIDWSWLMPNFSSSNYLSGIFEYRIRSLDCMKYGNLWI